MAAIKPGNVSQFVKYLCQTVAAYVSQTDYIEMFQDVITFPRRQVLTAAMCGSDRPVPTTPTDVLVITNFPVGGVTSITGQSSLNVLGMSAVRASTMIKDPATGQDVYLMPSCQTVATPAHESAVISALSLFYGQRDLIWSQFLLRGTAGGFLVFAPMVIPCAPPVTIPMIRQLPNATTALGQTPMRYYVARVAAIQVTAADGTTTSLSGIPSMFVMDTGSTQCMLPGPSGPANAAAIMASTSTVIVLGSGSRTVALPYLAARGDMQAGALDVFTSMEDGVANDFSSKHDVGILGCTAMRGMYIEYNLTQFTFGIGVATA